MGKDPLTKDIFGWMGGGTDQNSLIQMFGGPSGQNISGTEAGQQQNATNAQNMWNTLFQSAQNYQNQTAGARGAVINRANQILSGNYNPAASPAYSPAKRSVENQYGAARENILSSLPGGGTQQRALANLAVSKGGTLSDVMSQILTGELSNAMNLGAASGPQAIQGLSTALQGGAVPGQMMSSIMQYLANLMNASVQGQGNMTRMI